MSLSSAALRICAVLSACIVVLGLHEPPEGAPQFRRDSVESADFLPYRNAIDEEEDSFGTRFLPLRDAVESVPETFSPSTRVLSSVRIPLRDAVEQSPIDENTWTFLDEWSGFGKIQSFSDVRGPGLKTNFKINQESQSQSYNRNEQSDVKNFDSYYQINRGYQPHPYRAGSSYQQLVDISQVPTKEELKEFSPGFTRVFQRAPQAEFKVLCYVTNWAFYRKAEGRFVPENLDPDLCTHIVYSFSSLDPETLTIKEFDPWADIDNGLYKRITSLDGPEVMLGLGGWTDSAGDKYSRLVSDGGARRRFVASVISFLRRHNFRGLHLDWNYPKCWQSDCRKGPASDKPNFTKLIQELRKEFARESPSLLLGIAISGYKEVIAEAYELSPLSASVDFLSVMSYDYHGAWETVTGHVAPLMERENDKYTQYNTKYTIDYLVGKGASRVKLLLGVPFYGQSFTLARNSASRPSENAPAAGAGEAGEFTRQPGMLSYYEICHRVRNQRWTVGRVDGSPHATSGDQWVGYEDPQSVMAKADYVVKEGLAGVAAWTADLDDFSNRCCLEAFPLLKALNRALGRLSGSTPRPGDCTAPPAPVTPSPPVLTTAVDSGAPMKPSTEYIHPSQMSSTTWPSWSQKPTEKPITTTKAPVTVSTTTSPWWTTTTRRTTTTAKPVTTTTTWWTTTSRTTTESTTTKAPSQGTTIPAPAVVMPPGGNKPGEKCSGMEYKPHHEDCNAYFRCVLGELRPQYCPGGLHFNRNNGVCDWPSSAKCPMKPQDVTEEAATTTTQRTTRPTRPNRRTTLKPKPTQPSPPKTTTRIPATRMTTTTVRTTKRPDSGCESGQYYEHEECDMFNICVNNVLLALSCADGLSWNLETNNCDWAPHVDCATRRSAPLTRVLEENEELLWFRNVPEGTCDGNEYYPYPGDCEKYLLCQWGKLEEADCPPGLHWNQRIGNCDWPTNSQCTEPGPTEEVTPPSNKPSTGRPTTTGTTAAPTPSTTAVPLEPLSGHFKVVCYFTNWAWYRKGLGKYLPEHIDPQLCTHVVYGFAVLDYSELTVKAHDSWADFDNKFYARVVALKEKGIKVSLAIGGWNDSAGDKYSRLVNSATARAKFIRHIIAFLEKYDFQGLDLDWEYPVCWQVDCSKGPKSDKEGFAALVKELSDEFRPRGLLLSTAVSPSKTVIDAGYDVPVLAKYFDWIAVMTYDFHGQWDKKTGHVAPLYYHPDDDVSFFNANFSLNYWIEQGAPARKIIMGMPLYGQSFTLSDAKNNGLNAKAPGPGTAGEFTKAAGFLAYYEICDRIKNRGWTVVEDPEGRMGPYAYKGTQWVSYDDVDTIKRKSELVRALGLGGGMIWALDLDDFRNRCGDGVHPLLTTIREVLRDPPGPQDNLANIPTPSTIITTTSTTTTRRPYHSGTAAGHMRPVIGNTEIDADRSEDTFKVVCYFTNWAWYRQSGGKYIPSDIDPELCTHVVYGFAVLDGSKLTIKPHDSWADIDNKFYEKVVALIEKGVKVSLAIGGWNDSAGDKYSRLVNSAESRARFIKHVIEFIEKYNFQGLDLDWEYPVCWQVDCSKGPDSDKEGFADLVKELSAEFRPRGLYLSTAVSPSKKVIDAGYDVPKLSKYFDWIAVMTYDYHGQWDKKTGHVAPMYEHPDDFDKTFNANFSINYWIESGADRKKIIMGMPMYGQSFSLADNGRHSLNSPTYGGGEAGDATRARGFLAYYEICNNIRKKGWHVVRDRRGRMGPYAYLRDQWVSFDDVPMIKHKSEFVKAMGLGGAMIWALDLDDFRNTCDCEEYPLLRTINRVLRGYPGQAPKCVLEDKTEIGDNEIIGGSEVSTTLAPVTTTSKRPSRPTKPIDTSGVHPYPPAVTSERPSTVRPTRPAITIGGSIDHTCGGKIFSPHESDCNKYYLCQFGVPQEQRCPAGLHWNKDHCDWPVNTNCENEISGLDVFEKPTRPPRPVVTKPTYVKPTVTSRPVVPVIPTERPKPDETVYVPAGDGKYKVVCYFTNWAWYRPGDGKYTPDDIDADLCTHVVYGFAVLDGDSLTIKAHDSWADFDNKFYDRVIALKAKGIKVLLAIGGWNDSAGDKYSRLVNSPSSRSKFITHVTAFLEKYGFDGLDLDWEYPKCWQVECGKGPASDKPSFAKFVKELSDEFRPRGWLLSSAVSPSKMVIDAGYEVPSLARDFDWIAIMAYDFHGHWDKQTGHVAPLYYHPDDTYDYFNANFSINYWIAKGAPPHKLVMGMPLYGQSFSLADSTKRGLNAKSYGPGDAGEFTRAGGFLAFYEICERVRSRGWKVERDSLGRIGPYAHKGTQWVSYDDVEDIRRKSNLVKELGLGGGMIWALDLDDFRGRCGCGKHPLLRTLNQELRGHKRTIYADCT